MAVKCLERTLPKIKGKKKKKKGNRTSLRRIPSLVVCPRAKNSNPSQSIFPEYSVQWFRCIMDSAWAPLPRPLSWDCPLLDGHLLPGIWWWSMAAHVELGREKVTLPTAHRLCLEVGQAWSLFCFPPSSLPRHLDPSLAFHRHDKESVPAFTNSLLLGGQLLAERYKHALFSKTFPISGGRRSATAGTTAAFG